MSANQVIQPAVWIDVAGALNDATSGGAWTHRSNANALFTITLASAGTPDTFDWAETGGSGGSGTGVAITGASQELADGVTITFGATTGHGAGDIWLIKVTANSLLQGKFRQHGFGALSRNLQDKLRDFLHVDDYGAKGDGATDSTAAIQNALNHAVLFNAGGSNGGKVHLGRGVYIVSSTIVIPRGVQLVGNTPFASVIRASAAFTTSGTKWISFVVSIEGIYPGPALQIFSTGLSDLTIDCGVTATNISCLSIGDPVLGGTEEGTLLERLYLFNYTDYALAATVPFWTANMRCGDLWCLARSGEDHYKSIFLSGASSRVHFYSITVASFGGNSSVYPGISVIGCVSIKLDHIHTESCAVGIYIQQGESVSVEGVYGNATVDTTVQIDPASFPAWSGGTTYLLGDPVTHSGVQFVCIQANTGNTPVGGMGDSFWLFFTPSTSMQIKSVDSQSNYALLDYRQSSINPSAPAYNAGTTYSRLSQVSYSGIGYVAIQVSGNIGHQPDISPAWWIPGTPVFNALDTYLDASCMTQVMGFKGRTGFGFDTFQNTPLTTVEVMGGSTTLDSPDFGINLRRWIFGAGHVGVRFPASLGHLDMGLLMEDGTDDMVFATVNNVSPGTILRIKQSGGVKIDNSISLQVTGQFGANGASPQAAATSGGAVATTGSTNTAPYGFTTAAQADGIVALLNAIRAALVANGIMS